MIWHDLTILHHPTIPSWIWSGPLSNRWFLQRGALWCLVLLSCRLTEAGCTCKKLWFTASGQSCDHYCWGAQGALDRWIRYCFWIFPDIDFNWIVVWFCGALDLLPLFWFAKTFWKTAVCFDCSALNGDESKVAIQTKTLQGQWLSGQVVLAAAQSYPKIGSDSNPDRTVPRVSFLGGQHAKRWAKKPASPTGPPDWLNDILNWSQLQSIQLPIFGGHSAAWGLCCSFQAQESLATLPSSSGARTFCPAAFELPHAASIATLAVFLCIWSAGLSACNCALQGQIKM